MKTIKYAIARRKKNDIETYYNCLALDWYRNTIHASQFNSIIEARKIIDKDMNLEETSVYIVKITQQIEKVK